MSHRYYIGPEGPTNARLAIVAEKPGPDELRLLQQEGKGRPLIGTTGRAVDQHLINIGTHRSNVWLTNAVKHFDTLGNPTTDDIKREQIELYRELDALPNLNCVVAMGNAALLSLSNFHYGGYYTDETGHKTYDLSHRRGSILQSWCGKKMVPTWHPSFYFHGEWRFRSVVEFDLARALDESQTPDLNLPERSYYVEPTYSEAIDWLRSLMGAKELAYDIETPYRDGWITCIAFSDDPGRAYCIPLTKQGKQPYWPPYEEMRIWRHLQAVLAQPKCEYITQNGLFDSWHLWRHGFTPPTWGFDTMYAHRLIAPDLPHKLEFLCSIYTREPYYKNESGKWDPSVRVPDRQFWQYNCKDAAITLEVARAEKEDMVTL